MTTLYMDSVALAADLRGLLHPIARRDADLARRLKRASDDMVEHINDGMCSTGRERRREYEAARSAALETLACVNAASSVGYLREGDQGLTARAKALIERLDGVRKAA